MAEEKKEERKPGTGPLGERMDAAMKRIKGLIRDVHFAAGPLNSAGKTCDRKGYQVARAFLEGKSADKLSQQDRVAMQVLLQVLTVLEEEDISPAIGAYVVKKLQGYQRVAKEVA